MTRHAVKQSATRVCVVWLSAYLAARAIMPVAMWQDELLSSPCPHPLQNSYPAKCPKYFMLHCLPQRPGSWLDGSALSKVQRGSREIEKANSPSRTGSRANGTQLMEPPCRECVPQRGVLSLLHPGWSLIFLICTRNATWTQTDTLPLPSEAQLQPLPLSSLIQWLVQQRTSIIGATIITITLLSHRKHFFYPKKRQSL